MLGVRGQAFALACVVVAVPAGAEVPTVDLHGGPVALQLGAPPTEDGFSSGAVIDLTLPDVSMNAKATASVGMGDQDLWRKQEADVSANWSAPAGVSVQASGSEAYTFTYRDPASLGDAGHTNHLIGTQTTSAALSASAPMPGGATLTVGTQGSSTQTEDASAPKLEDRSAVGTQTQEAFANLSWSPVPWLGIEGGATARTADVNWHRQQTHATAYTSVDPRVQVDVTPWDGAQWSTSVEHTVAPYDTAAYTAYANAAQPTDAAKFEPDHAWRLQSRLQQTLGPVQASVSYTADRNGTATEFAQASGQQVPASTALLSRDKVDLALSMPLTAVGLPHTSFNSEASWQASRVVDPVTSELRAASGQTPDHYAVKLVRTLPSTRLSVGVVGELNGARNSYQVSELSSTEASGTLGAFVSFKPDAYEVDLNVSGIGGASTTDYFFRGTRSDAMPARTVQQAAPGPMVSLSLHKSF